MKIGKIICVLVLLTSFFTTPIEIYEPKTESGMEGIGIPHVKYNLDYTKLNKTPNTLLFSTILLLVLSCFSLMSSSWTIFKAYLLLFVPILKHSALLKPIKFQSNYVV